MKYLRIYSKYKSITKIKVHKLVKSICDLLEIKIDSLEINFISGKEIESINSQHLKHYYTTDIITFNYSEINNKLDGELFISVEDAEENAKKYKVSFQEEITRLVIHGILHLLGYDDQERKNKIKMKRKENQLLNTLKFILL